MAGGWRVCSGDTAAPTQLWGGAETKGGDWLGPCAQPLACPSPLRPRCATPPRSAPEVLKGKRYSAKSDVFSFGKVGHAGPAHTPAWTMPHARRAQGCRAGPCMATQG